MRSIPEGIRTGDDRELTTPQSRFASQLPFTGEPLVRCVGVDALIDPCREAAKGRRADVGIRPYRVRWDWIA